MTFKFSASGEPVVDDFPAIGAAVVLLTPDSRGHMELKSPDPLDAPTFHPNYLSDPGDIRRSIAGLRLMRRIANTAPLASRIIEERVPGASVATDEQWLAHLKTCGNSGWHRVGTCRMVSMRRPLSTRGCACAASRGCASPTRRSCRRSSPAIPMRPAS